MALKNAYRIRSGVSRDQPKGTQNTPFVVSSSVLAASAPSSYELPYNNAVQTTWEPSNGFHPNFGAGTSHYDDTAPNGAPYANANAFFDLCGPAASDIALWYWPAQPNFTNLSNVYDNWDGVTTTWNGTDIDGVARMRGYMMKLAWRIKAPTWTSTGMMNAQPRSSAVMLQIVRDGLNWEASGENISTWSSYFYIVAWYPSLSESTFHSDVVADTWGSNVPVVAEVNSQLMPNWPHNGELTRHFITIIGYDDVNSRYFYTDTCASSTNCGSLYDGGVSFVSRSTLWTAITNVPYNQSTGDGGWVW